MNKPLPGFVVALSTEWRHFRRAFSKVRRLHAPGFKGCIARLGDLDCMIAVAGAGKANAAAAAQALANHQAGVLVSLGFAGALSPQLVRGDIVLSAYSSRGLSEQPGDWEKFLEQQLFMLADRSHEHHVYVSPLHTADRIVARAEEKRKLYLETNAGIVDMESSAISAIARQNGLPFVGIHVVSDTAEENIPALEVIAPFLASKSVWRYVELAGRLLVRPQLVLDLAGLSRGAKLAGSRLAHFLRANELTLGNVLRTCSVSHPIPSGENPDLRLRDQRPR